MVGCTVLLSCSMEDGRAPPGAGGNTTTPPLDCAVLHGYNTLHRPVLDWLPWNIMFFISIHCPVVITQHCNKVAFISMHCTLLCCTTVYCTALHCTELYSISLHLISLYNTTLHFTALNCTVLYPLHCNTLHCTALHSIVQHGTGTCTAAVKRVKGGSNIWPQGAKTLRQKTVAPGGYLYRDIKEVWSNCSALPSLKSRQS